MNLLHKNNSNKKRFAVWRQWLLFFLLLSAVYPLSKSFYKNYQKDRELDGDINNYRDEVSALRTKKYELRKYLDYVKSDEFIDKQARLSLNYKKKGEEVVVVKDDGAVASVAANDGKVGLNKYGVMDEKNSAPTRSNILKWRDHFFGS